MFSFLFEISMTNSNSLFDLILASLLPISWVRLFSIAHGLNFFLFSGCILHLNYVGFDWAFDLGDSSYSAKIWRALCLPTLLSACNFLITPSFISTSQLLLPAIRLSPQFAHLNSFGRLIVLSFAWSSSPQFRQTPFFLILFLHVRICGNYDILWASLGTCIQWLFLQVEGKKYCRSVRYLWLDETRCNKVFFFQILDWIRSFVGR